MMWTLLVLPCVILLFETNAMQIQNANAISNIFDYWLSAENEPDFDSASSSKESWERKTRVETKAAKMHDLSDWLSDEDESDTNVSSYSGESQEQVTSTVSDVNVTTDAPVMCPPEKSLHSREDLRNMIDYMTRKLSIDSALNSSYYFKAVEVRNKHMHDVTEFQAWFQDRPEHLKHVLDDLDFLKSHIEPLINRVANELKEYSSLEKIFKEKLGRSKKIFTDLDKFKVICNNFCQIKLLSDTSLTKMAIVANDGYYCSSLQDLYQHINSSLLDFVKNVTSAMESRITNDDTRFTKVIDELKKKLKDTALKEFGMTMYDVLNLQDDYHHFIEDIEKIDTTFIYTIKETNLEIDAKLLVLEKRTEEYGAYCITCSNKVFRTVPRQQPLEYTSGNPDILEELLHLKFEQYKSMISEEYSSIFEELDTFLNSNIQNTTLNSFSLEPIQQEIVEKIQKARESFNELKSKVPQSSITKLLELSTDSLQLLSNINAAVDSLKQFSFM